jgi:hypothetical protein
MRLSFGYLVSNKADVVEKFIEGVSAYGYIDKYYLIYDNIARFFP